MTEHPIVPQHKHEFLRMFNSGMGYFEALPMEFFSLLVPSFDPFKSDLRLELKDAGFFSSATFSFCVVDLVPFFFHDRTDTGQRIGMTHVFENGG